MKHVHFIGIGGTGLSAIARILLEKGYIVSGSDRTASPLFKAITAAGAQTYLGHAPEQISGADLVIRSSAIPDDNPEVIAALAKGIKVSKRADFLEELTAGKQTIAVAGSHGKTTTTAMLIWILRQLGTDPSFIAGGVINQLDCNAHAGSGPYFVIEADEYDYMFLGLTPRIAIITNIEHDHPDCFPTKVDYRDAYQAFLHRLTPEGVALVCLDDPQTQLLREEMAGTAVKMLGYGLSDEANYRVEKVDFVDGFPRFSFIYQDENSLENLGTATLRLPGSHNVLNATAVLGVIHQLGLPLPQAIKALEVFTGVGRRFEILGAPKEVLIIDDYGHHPTQIRATIEAARSRYVNRRIWVVWQPHTFSRTQMLEKEYIEALNTADQVVVLKIYSAREADPGYSAVTIAKALPDQKAHYCHSFEEATQLLLSGLKPNDVMILFSAGDATKVSQNVLRALQNNPAKEGGKA